MKETEIQIRLDTICPICEEKHEFVAVAYSDPDKPVLAGVEGCINCVTKIKNALDKVLGNQKKP